jgi:hypothetical protein
MTEQELSDGYFAAMRAQDVAALAALFTPDGTLVWPDGTTIVGHAAIRETYARLFQHPSNNPQPGPLMLGPDSFAIEVASRMPNGEARRTCNVFRLAPDGLLARMDSYRQD